MIPTNNSVPDKRFLSTADVDMAVVDAVIYVNRQSSRNNARGHTAKIAAMNETDVQTGIAHKSETYTFIGSGCLKELGKHKFFDNPEKLPKGCYFGWLRDLIEKKLKTIPPGKKLLVKVHSLDRLYRPLRFDSKKPETWDFTTTDFDMFDYYIKTCFGERAEDVVFIPLNEGAALHIRGLQSLIGQQNGKGGRPSIIQKSYRVKPHLKPEAVGLASIGWNARMIADHIEKKYKRRLSSRAIRGWLQEAGVSSPRGRPKGKNKMES